MSKFRFSCREEVPALRQLWKQAFGDSDEYLDLFFSRAYAPDRCRILEKSGIGGAAYWLRCDACGLRLAYVYGVAIREDLQNQGFGSALMEDLRATLKQEGYDGILLVPGDEGLRRYYEKLGYRTISWQDRFEAEAGHPAQMKRLTTEQYAAFRSIFSLRGYVAQEKENLALLEGMADFYLGEDFLVAVAAGEGECLELLGNRAAAPGITAALGLETCRFRAVGGEFPYAMGLSLGKDLPEELYFGFGFD